MSQARRSFDVPGALQHEFSLLTAPLGLVQHHPSLNIKLEDPETGSRGCIAEHCQTQIAGFAP